MPMPKPCLCCRPDCYFCFPDLWIARVNADFAANHERYAEELREAEAQAAFDDADDLPPIDVEKMMRRVNEMIRQDEEDRAARRRIAGSN